MCFSILFMISSAYADTILSIYLEVFKNNTVILDELKVMSGRATAYTISGDYKLEILDNNNKVLIEKSINLNFMIMSDPPQPTNSSFINQKLDFNSSMKYVKLFFNGTEIFSREIIPCNNNGVCDEYESYLSCPSDCPLNELDGICTKDNDGVCDPDCSPGADPDCEETQNTGVCGNNLCESNETQDNCCKDCGCPTDMKCANNKCESEKCGDGKCDKGENHGNCQKDCFSGLKDGYCDGIKDGLCDPDCSKDKDVDCEKGVGRIIIYVIIGVVMVSLLFFIFSRMRGRTEGVET